MNGWAGIALALRAPQDDALRSRIPTVLHPLAGRSVAWHVLRTLAALSPRPAQTLFLSVQEIDPAALGEVPVELLTAAPDAWWGEASARLRPDVGRVLLVDAAAATLSASLASLAAGPPGRVLVGPAGGALAVWLTREEAERRAATARTLDEFAAGLVALPLKADEAVVVRDRAQLARAIAVVRDRVVRRLLEGGATFLLPETVLVDVDVQIGPDTVVYPGVVLEGNTTIGAETVVGPGCRIIDSWVGSGVELKGYNYIVGANVRNRAVLEPYVRRGFD